MSFRETEEKVRVFDREREEKRWGKIGVLRKIRDI